MVIGQIQKKIKIPERTDRGIGCKYPIDTLQEGQGFLVQLTEDDGPEATLASLRKRIVNAVRQQERRLGRTKAGDKVKDFAVWCDDDGVMVALRKDNSAQLPLAKKSAPQGAQKATQTVKKAPSQKPAVTFTPISN
jgi:hypothetical protein